MTARDTQLRYGNVAMTLHWIIAALLIINLGLGLSMASLPRTAPNLGLIVMLHKSTGLTILVLSVLRLVWRLMNPWPPLPQNLSPALRALARTTHVLFYVMIIGIPLTGWAMVSASPRQSPIMWYGLFEWPKIAFLTNLAADQKRPVTGMLAETHELLAFLTIALIVLHVAGALYHHFIHRDQVLKRMVPGTKVAGDIGQAGG